ncbi:DegT/DnrJ/EryC1/StrS family aminotransferase [Phytoactinopolyspora halotolerans]|uniref:DegT/DnrJ/EryC1/StrS family aminotransferase n=1 Tax=Phytoactinopolyspora halotolerans TaxID=1981512 RepID=A0A6L9SCM6_9ACTN|nr:DegT/DnrJ/EryC1/StrS family aminotransferase [Phytoactinopolyspora halotolerans]NEE02311.1 DegT/DnrJ/EryC1/StrS family aminotransferase [Phytoactinopolyspora halotolerans]
MDVTTDTLALHGGTPALGPGDTIPGWPEHDDAEEQAVLGVLRSGRWGSTHGDVVATFEREFADYQQAAHGICLVNGTMAIVVALRACGVGIGDEVIVPPYTFIATASAALFIGAVPVFADVQPATHLLDPAAVEAAITPRTKAIVAVHLAGRPADMDALAAVAARHSVAVVEDAAQAHGAEYRGRRVGAIGDVGTFSFQSSKNMTAGEGGAVLTDDERAANALYSLVNVGRVRGGGWYEHTSVGYNLRLTEFQAAILRAQLARHPAQQQVRERNATLLTQLLGDVDGIELAQPDPAVTAHGRHLFVFRVPALGAAGTRDAAVRALAAEGLPGASSGYVPLHRNEALMRETRAVVDRLGQPYPEPDCPVADQVSTDTIWLPQPYLLGDDEFTHRVAGAIAKVVRAAAALK